MKWRTLTQTPGVALLGAVLYLCPFLASTVLAQGPERELRDRIERLEQFIGL